MSYQKKNFLFNFNNLYLLEHFIHSYILSIILMEYLIKLCLFPKIIQNYSNLYIMILIINI
jgi:membrane protein insertase Oxa1/YidC/SpoIIIJ